MRIAVFDDLPEGGAKRVVFEQVKGLSQNHSVYYITNQLPTRFPFRDYATDVFTFPFGLWPLKSIFRPLQELSYYPTYQYSYSRIQKLLQELEVAVVIIHPSRLTQCPTLLIPKNIPSIYFAHEWLRIAYEPENHPLPTGLAGRYETLRRQWLKKLDAAAVTRMTRILTTSAYNCDRIRWAYGREAAVIPLGVDADTFRPHHHSDRRYFLFIGDKHVQNGADLLPQDKRLPVKFVTFSNNKFRYSDKELADLYAGAYATMCLGRNEPFGLSPLESMACQTPVIALAEGGYTETVIHGKTGWLTAPCRDTIRASMEYVLAHPKLQEMYGKTGRSQVVAKYRWDTHIHMLEQVLDEVVND